MFKSNCLKWCQNTELYLAHKRFGCWNAEGQLSPAALLSPKQQHAGAATALPEWGGAAQSPGPAMGARLPAPVHVPVTPLLFISLKESLLQWVSHRCAWVVTAVPAAQVSPTHWNTFKAFTWWLCPAPAAAHPPYSAHSRPGPWLLHFAELHRGFQPSIYTVSHHRLEVAKGQWPQNLPRTALKSTGHTAAKSPLRLY